VSGATRASIRTPSPDSAEETRKQHAAESKRSQLPSAPDLVGGTRSVTFQFDLFDPAWESKITAAAKQCHAESMTW
jgi:hypothetical protein